MKNRNEQLQQAIEEALFNHGFSKSFATTVALSLLNLLEVLNEEDLD